MSKETLTRCPLYLDRAIHLNGDWEMCLSQLYLPRSEITVFSDCKIEFRYDLLPKQSPKTEKGRLWNEKLKCLCENEKKQTITISITAGNYDTEIIIDLINQTIQDMKVYKRIDKKLNWYFPMVRTFSKKYQRSWMLKEELLFNFKMKLKASKSVVNWPICLVL